MPELRAMIEQPNASAASQLKTHRVLLVTVIVEAIAAGGIAAAWYQSQASAALEKARVSGHLSAVEQQLAEKNGDLERCSAWMNARLLLAEGLDAPAASPSPRVLLPAPVASALATASAAPEDSASAVPLAQAPDSNGAEVDHFQRSRRVRATHGQSSFLESAEGAAKAFP
jgi:hypothetical protein